MDERMKLDLKTLGYIKVFEKQFGRILSPEELQAKSAKRDDLQ